MCLSNQYDSHYRMAKEPNFHIVTEGIDGEGMGPEG